jgi:hypothetical protein
VQYGLQADQAMLGQLDGLLDGVDEPSENDFPGGPLAITFQEFLDGGRLLPVLVIRLLQSSKDGIEGMQEGALNLESPLGPALYQRQKVVYVQVVRGDGALCI